MNRRHAATILLVLVTTALSAADLRYRSDRQTSSLAEGSERTTLSGNVHIETEGTAITADEVEIYGPNYRYLTCSGNLEVIDEEQGLYITGDTLFLDRTADSARIEGNALMEDRRNGVIVMGGLIEHLGEQDVMRVQIGVRIFKDDIVARGEFARYERETELLQISGLPVVYHNGNEYRATRILINLDTEEIQLQGGVAGSLESGD